jgi:hypothetical protein
MTDKEDQEKEVKDEEKKVILNLRKSLLFLENTTKKESTKNIKKKLETFFTIHESQNVLNYVDLNDYHDKKVDFIMIKTFYNLEDMIDLTFFSKSNTKSKLIYVK